MPLVATISITEEGFGYHWYSEEGKVKHEGFVEWSKIKSIDVYKRDLFSYDLICMDLSCGGTPNDLLEIDEEDLNWEALIAAFSQRLPGIKPWSGWFSAVAFPAFETNRTRIYQRAE